MDATFIGADSATKSADKHLNLEMHQHRKGQQWYFGMKMHIGVDADSGPLHTVVDTAANIS